MMLLAVQERIVLMNTLPSEGNVITLKLIRELREQLSFSEMELKDWNIVSGEDQRITWDAAAAGEKEITVGDAMKAIIVRALKKLDETNKLTMGQLSLYEKFIDGIVGKPSCEYSPSESSPES